MSIRDIPEYPRQVCEAFVAEVERLFGDNVYGIYLYGAVVFPDSGPVQDLDFHVVLKRPISESERADVRAIHRRLGERFPDLGEEVDAYFILLEDAKGETPPTHLLAPPRRDEAWALHCAHVRAGRFLTLSGEAPSEIFPAPSWARLSEALDGEVAFILRNLQHSDYCVLNLCRILYSFETRDVVVSKRFSGKWGIQNLPEWAAVIRAAMRSYEGAARREDRDLLEQQAMPFLRYAERRIGELR